MPKLLEVIVTSAEEAREAEAGGADRVELVRALPLGGLTPAFAVAAEVLSSVSIPVRVMLRETASLSIGDDAELASLCDCAFRFAQFPVDGFVLGFVKDGLLDCESMHAVLERVPKAQVTFHRAFENAQDPLQGIEELKRSGQVDRILTSGGDGSWPERMHRLEQWQAAGLPEIQILVGLGLSQSAIEEVNKSPTIAEVHVGRAARVPQTNEGVVSRERIAALKSALR